MTDVQRPPIAKPPQPKKTRATTVKLTPAQWHEIEQAWAEGRFSSAQELADQYKVPVKVVQTHLRDKKIAKGQAIAEYNRKVQEELEKKAQAEAKLLASRIAETREEHYRMASGITKLTYAEILKAKPDGVPLSAVKQNLASLESAMKVLKMAREERFAVLGVDKEGSNLDEDETPELVVSELTPEQMEEMRQKAEQMAAQDGDDDDDIVDLSGELGDLGEEDQDEE